MSLFSQRKNQHQITKKNAKLRSQNLVKVAKIAILSERHLEYFPSTCKLLGQDQFWAFNFYFYTDLAVFTTNGRLNDGKIVFVSGCFIEWGYAKTLLLKDGARRVDSSFSNGAHLSKMSRIMNKTQRHKLAELLLVLINSLVSCCLNHEFSLASYSGICSFPTACFVSHMVGIPEDRGFFLRQGSFTFFIRILEINISILKFVLT